MLQPKNLTIVKVVKHGLLSQTVYAQDESGNVWKRLEGFGESEWTLFKQN